MLSRLFMFLLVQKPHVWHRLMLLIDEIETINKAEGAFTPPESAKINSSQCSRWLVNQTVGWMTQPSGTSVSKGCGAAHVVKANKWIRGLIADVWFQGKTKILKINPSATSGICLKSAMTVGVPLPCQHSYYHRELWELIHQWPNEYISCFSARTCLSYDCSPPLVPICLGESRFRPILSIVLFFKCVVKVFWRPKGEERKAAGTIWSILSTFHDLIMEHCNKNKEGWNCQREKLRYQKLISKQVGWRRIFSTTAARRQTPTSSSNLSHTHC